MVKRVKKVKRKNGVHVSLRVVIPESLHKAVKAKCILMDTKINRVITDTLSEWVKDVLQQFEAIREKE